MNSARPNSTHLSIHSNVSHAFDTQNNLMSHLNKDHDGPLFCRRTNGTTIQPPKRHKNGPQQQYRIPSKKQPPIRCWNAVVIPGWSSPSDCQIMNLFLNKCCIWSSKTVRHTETLVHVPCVTGKHKLKMKWQKNRAIHGMPLPHQETWPLPKLSWKTGILWTVISCQMNTAACLN